MAPKTLVELTNEALYDDTFLFDAPVALNGGVSYECNSVAVQADPQNTDDIFVGNEDSQSWQLAAGELVSLDINDLVKVWVRPRDGTQRANVLAVGPPPGEG